MLKTDKQLKKTWMRITTGLQVDEFSMHREWRNLKKLYNGEFRMYHTFSHLAHLFREMTMVEEHIQDIQALAFAIFYHDAIYETFQDEFEKNEKQSAEMAENFLSKYNEQLAAKVSELILSTEKHSALRDDKDFAYFLDMDLAILGSNPQVYKTYSLNIRDEYAWVSNVAYNEERAQALNKFLIKEKIYQTSEFYERYEKQARDNIVVELESLARNEYDLVE